MKAAAILLHRSLIRDQLQNHTLQDVGSKSYDRWNYMPEKRAAMKCLSGLSMRAPSAPPAGSTAPANPLSRKVSRDWNTDWACG
jgi:hypothetical protein